MAARLLLAVLVIVLRQLVLQFAATARVKVGSLLPPVLMIVVVGDPVVLVPLVITHTALMSAG